jgi:hypothetical protein
MTIVESNPRQLVLRSGSSTVTLDKQTGKAVLQRKLLLWPRKPIERQLSEIAEIRIGAQVDRASGVQICKAILVMTAGDGWALKAADKEDATRKVAALREFLGMTPA